MSSCCTRLAMRLWRSDDVKEKIISLSLKYQVVPCVVGSHFIFHCIINDI